MHAIGINGGIKQHGISSDDYSPAETAQPICGEWGHILVPSRSPNIEKLFSPLDIENVLWRERSLMRMRGLPCGGRKFWSHHSTSESDSRVDIFQRECWRHSRIAQKTVAVESEATRSRVTTVLPNWTQSPIPKTIPALIGFVQASNSGRKYEGSFLSDECMPRNGGLIVSGYPQSRGKNSNDERCQSGDRILIAFDKIARTPSVTIDRQSEKGAILLWGSLAFLVLVACYTLREWLRERPFKNYKTGKNCQRNNEKQQG